MAGIPQNFQAISNVLANYDFVDIVSGTGIIQLYAGNTVDTKLLSNHTFYSDVLYHEGTTTGAAAEKVLDLDFDVLLNRPLDIKGKVVVNVPIYLYCVSGVGAYVKVRVRKWDGSTETEIYDNDSSVLTIGGGGGTSYALKAIDLTIPLTHFKIGEYLRLTVEGWADITGANNATMRIANDPMNRITDGTLDWDSTAEIPSKLVFQCPVRLNL